MARDPTVADARNALVLFPGALGDLVCFLPALEKIARCGPVDLLARTEYAGILVERISVTVIERHEISRLFAPNAEQDGRLREFFGGYERVYSWAGSDDANFVGALGRLCPGDLRCFRFQPRAFVHAADYYAACVGEASPGRHWRRILGVRPDADAWARQYAVEHAWGKKKILFLGPGSGAREKNWPARAYQEVARAWERHTGGATVVVLGPVEEENAELLDHFKAEAHVVRGVELGRMAALLRRSDFYVGNDSGLTHLAAALGLPTIAIFGPSDRACWAPRGTNVTVLSLDVECSPCARETMRACAHRRCLTTLDPERVISRLVGELDRFGARPHLDKVIP